MSEICSTIQALERQIYGPALSNKNKFEIYLLLEVEKYYGRLEITVYFLFYHFMMRYIDKIRNNRKR